MVVRMHWNLAAQCGACKLTNAHYAMDYDLTLKAAALDLGFVTEAEFDRIVDPAKMVKSYVATAR